MVKYNIILVGDSGVGKTQLINRLRGYKFCHNYKFTMDITKYKIIHNGHELWITDTPGHFKYAPDYVLSEFHFDCAIMMFDGKSKLSFDNLDLWHKIIVKKYGNVPIILCGNKKDFCNQIVSKNTAHNYANKKKFMCFYDYFSVRLNINFDKLLDSIVEQISKIKQKDQSIYTLDENKQTNQNTTIII